MNGSTSTTHNDAHGQSRLCSALAFKHAKSTFQTRAMGSGQPLANLDRAFANIVTLRDKSIGITSDGIGTKIEIAERLQRYDTLGYDLVAMVADDLVTMGIDPTNISNILDVDRLCSVTIDQLMGGLARAATTAGLIVTGGEIAELGPRIQGYGDGMHFNWCATAIGILEENLPPITGEYMRPGDLIIALREQGFRSNGFTLARSILEKHFGDQWHHRESHILKQTYGEGLLKPSRIYTPLIRSILKSRIPLRGLAHITGAGIPGNLGRILKACQLGAHLTELYTPSLLMSELMQLGQISPEQAYQQWNMGNGMLVIASQDEVSMILTLAEQLGYEARVAGTVTPGPVRVNIQYKGQYCVFNNPGK